MTMSIEPTMAGTSAMRQRRQSSLVTGERTIDLGSEFAWESTIGPEGISRVPMDGLIDGRIYYRHGIARLESEEDFIFETGRGPVIYLEGGGRERSPIAPEVNQQQVAEAVVARGKRLEVTGAGEWKAKSALRLNRKFKLIRNGIQYKTRVPIKWIEVNFLALRE